MVQKTLWIALLFITSIVLVSCKNDDDATSTPEQGSLEIFFKPVYGDEETLINRNDDVEYANGKNIRLRKSEMYLGNLVLGNAETNEVISEIEYIELSDPMVDPSTGLTNKILVFEGVNAGLYDHFEFGVGVPEELNAMTPSDFSSDHPLSKGGNYWVPWDSYIFSKFEGRMAVNQSDSFNLSFIYHSGQDELYRTLQFDMPIEIVAGEVSRIEILIDHRDLFIRSATDYVDIEETPVDHSAGELDLVKYIADNFENAFSARVVN